MLSHLLSACGDASYDAADGKDVRVLEMPSAAGSFAPNLAAGSTGEIVLSWLEPDAAGNHALKFSRLQDGRWSAAQEISRGGNWFANWADFPAVTPVNGNLWVAHWLVRRPAGGYAYDIHAAVSNDAGSSWSAPFSPHTDDTDTEHGFVSLFPQDDGFGMVWLDGRKFINEVTEDVAASGMTLRSATFGPDGDTRREWLLDELICDCCQTDVAMTSAGPIAVYRDRTVNEIRDIYVTRLTSADWSDGMPVSDDGWEIPGCPVNGPVALSAGHSVAVAWFSAARDEPRVQVAWSGDAGRTFGKAIVVSDNKPLGHVGAAMLENGDLVVSWQKRTGDGNADLRLRRVSRNGELGSVYVVDEARDVFAFSVPQILHHGDDLLLAWTTSIDEAYAVHSALVPLTLID